jgi:hypothetical protein
MAATMAGIDTCRCGCVTRVRRYIDEFMADTTIDNIIRALTPSSQKLKERAAARTSRAHVRMRRHVTP